VQQSWQCIDLQVQLIRLNFACSRTPRFRFHLQINPAITFKSYPRRAMHLLDTSTRKIKYFVTNVPAYAILSHTWGDEEVTFKDIEQPYAAGMKGYKKILLSCAQAHQDGYAWIWVDTCCTIQTHHRQQCTTKSAAYVAESGGTMYIAF
jgi:hypothetical protein